MRFLYIAIVVLFLGACSQKHHDHDHDHDAHHNHHDHHATGDHKHVQSVEAGGCTLCKEHGGDKNHEECAACKEKSQKRSCCSEEKGCTDKDAATCTAETANLETSPKLLKNISQDEFATVYAQNRDKIGKSCSAPAMKYCGKTTKDTNISETELACLWTKVFRVTRETLPELDGTPCAKMIKGFAKKK